MPNRSLLTALARAFPRSRVAGLDFSRIAISQASVRNAGHEYIWSEDGAIPRNFDVIVTSNCLEYFDAPLAVLEKHLAACGNLYIVLAPYNESPLHPQHRVQFQAPSFPIRIGDFTRIHVEPLLVNRHYWPGEQFLVIYASGRYLRDSVDRPDPMAQAIARLEAARSQESRRADAATAGLPGRTRCQETEGGMSKEDNIEVTGVVLEKFPSGLFSVQLEHDRVVLAHLAGRLRRNRIRVLAGDRVTMELSPYDLTKGRITFRHR